MQLHAHFKLILSNLHLPIFVVFFRRIQEDEPTDEDVAENDNDNDDEDEDDPEDEYDRFVF